jgi:hypothetical protein
MFPHQPVVNHFNTSLCLGLHIRLERINDFIIGTIIICMLGWKGVTVELRAKKSIYTDNRSIQDNDMRSYEIILRCVREFKAEYRDIKK